MQRKIEKENQERQTEAIDRVVKLSATFQRVFDGEDGNKVLKHMEAMIKGFDCDPYQHAYNAGFRRYHEIIKQMLNQEEYERHLDLLKNAENKT